ncbi:MAG: hypothetical protein O3C65_15105 [Proteobacteria bacterium]|nr:hypothetical protein [Gemmatimonadota bacterium]MDA1060002.1 hypothetical protein [Pseudomonadota bacterium]
MAGPASSDTLKSLYYKAFTALADDADTNWLLANAPDVYLYGAMLEAMPYLRNDARLPVWAELYAGAVDGLNSVEKGDRFSGDALQMRTLTGNPEEGKSVMLTFAITSSRN